MKNRKFDKIYAQFKGNEILLVSLLYYLLMCFITPGFFSVSNTWNLLYGFIPIMILALGQTLVMITAGIDLSITSIIAMASITGGYLMSADTSILTESPWVIMLGVGAMLLVSSLIGAINGVAISFLKMPAFMVTLTSMLFFSGFAIWLTQSSSYYNLPVSFIDFPYSSFLYIPSVLILGVLFIFLTYILLNKTLLGEWIYAIGVNAETAKLSGVRISKTTILVYAISGLSAGLAAILYTARLETGSPVMGQNILLDVIGAVVIGGTSLFGGKGKVSWTVAGAFLITMLDNSLNLFNISFFLIMMIKGALILLIAFLNIFRQPSSIKHA